MSLKLDEIFSNLKKKPSIFAISGGVDSMVLLDLAQQSVAKNNIIVAHIDHGIRENSAWEKRFVESYCRDRNLIFESTELHLGPSSNEAQARQERYDFLGTVQKKYHAPNVVTAHHQDDIIETMIMNVIRGTGRRGLVSLKSRDNLKRPLLSLTKAELYKYALKHKLEWLEDETNRSTSYQRNHIRLDLIPRALKKDKNFPEKLIKIRSKILSLDAEIDKLTEEVRLSHMTITDGRLSLSRQKFIMLNSLLRRELIMHILRNSGVDLTNIGLENVVRMEHFICTAKPAKQLSPASGILLSSSLSQVYFSFSKD